MVSCLLHRCAHAVVRTQQALADLLPCTNPNVVGWEMAEFGDVQLFPPQNVSGKPACKGQPERNRAFLGVQAFNDRNERAATWRNGQLHSILTAASSFALFGLCSLSFAGKDSRDRGISRGALLPERQGC